MKSDEETGEGCNNEGEDEDVDGENSDKDEGEGDHGLYQPDESCL